MDISWCILILIIVCLVVVGIIGSITATKENRGREMSCKTARECSPFNVSLELTAPKEDISLPTHCLNVLDKESFCRDLAGKGVEIIKAPYKDRYIYFIKDPEGNRIEVFDK